MLPRLVRFSSSSLVTLKTIPPQIINQVFTNNIEWKHAGGLFAATDLDEGFKARLYPGMEDEDTRIKIFKPGYKDFEQVTDDFRHNWTWINKVAVKPHS
jgi:hypothetical protein